MYLAYIDDSDDSDSTKPKDQRQAEPFQVLCAVLVEDKQFLMLEMKLSVLALTGYVPLSELPDDFEFHAKDLFHGTGWFDKWPQPVRFGVFKQLMEALAALNVPVIYGAVDRMKLSKQIFKSANPLDVAFRLCIDRIQSFLAKDSSRTGLLIADTFDDGKKRNLKRVFREYRKKFVTEAIRVMEDLRRAKENASAEAPIPLPSGRIPTSNLIDDMYFGDSSDSIGIQAADMCAFLVRRHLAGKQDSEWLYKIIEPLLVGQVWP